MRISFVTTLALTASMLLPGVALAVEGTVDATADIEVQAIDGKPLPPPRLPLLKKMEGTPIKDARAELRGSATTSLRGELRDIRQERRDDRMATSSEKRAALKEARENVFERLKERRTEIKGRLKAEAARGLNSIIAAFTAMLENLSTIDARIDAHIQSLEASGTTDTQAAKDASQKAKDAISAATKAVDDAHVSMEIAASSTSPKERLPEIRTAVKNAQSAVQTARKAIETAVKTLRALHIESSASVQSGGSTTN